MTLQVLIIDDDSSFRKLLEVRLRSFLGEIHLTSFETLSKAREWFQSQERARFDLAVLDEHLPDGRGAEFLAEGWLKEQAVLSMSSDDAPEIPGSTLSKGATFFLNKRQISEPLFRPLVLGVIERNKLQQMLTQATVQAAMVETVRTLIGTLRHEINNPLGAVLGAVYLLRNSPNVTEQQRDAAALIEESGKRIKHVMEQLTSALSLETVKKAESEVFQIPGDVKWEK